MKTTHKKTYQMPQVARVELDSEISLTLDSSLLPMGDPEAMMGSMLVDPNPFGNELL